MSGWIPRTGLGVLIVVRNRGNWRPTRLSLVASDRTGPLNDPGQSRILPMETEE